MDSSPTLNSMCTRQQYLCGSRVAGGGLAIMNSARKSSQRVVGSHFQGPAPRKDRAQLKRSLECPAGLFPGRLDQAG